MEPYQYWAIAGFIFLVIELFTLKTLPLVLCGALFFAGVIAYKYPDVYIAQFATFLVFVPIVYSAIKPHTRSKKTGGKNEHK